MFECQKSSLNKSYFHQIAKHGEKLSHKTLFILYFFIFRKKKHFEEIFHKQFARVLCIINFFLAFFCFFIADLFR